MREYTNKIIWKWGALVKKRVFAFLLVMCLVVSAMPKTVFASGEKSLNGKIISIMGDSISTFEGQPHSERNRYPGNAEGSGVDTVNDTWWMQLINDLGATLGICEARGSSTVTNIYEEGEVPSGQSGRKGPSIAMASWNRINDLDENGTPDIILLYGGTNDYNAVYRDHLYEMGTFDPAGVPSLEEYDPKTDTAIKWDNVVDGFVAAVLRIKATYPDAELIGILPINGNKNDFNTTIKAIYDHYGVTTVSLESVSSVGLWDNLHPNAYGMDLITAEVKAVLTNSEVKYPLHPDAKIKTLPADALPNTNLWSDPDEGYYKGKTWNTRYPSITIPVIEGDRIYASSFQSKAVTGGTSNGVAVTFIADGAVKTMISPADVYTEYTINGYITVPAGVDAVCIPMWKNNEDSVVNLLTLPRVTEEPKNDHLQELPDNVYKTTNIWEILTPEHTYNNGTTWRNNYKDIWSVTIPVEPGDRIYASSFQSASVTGGTSNGIAVAFFYGNEVVSSLLPAATFEEYTKNGYITVPEGVNAVCIPMWKSTTENVINLLDKPNSPGEVSGDGSVDELDAMILARYVAGWSGYEEKIVSMDAADINKDGSVDDIDAMIFARYMANWTGYDKYFK